MVAQIRFLVLLSFAALFTAGFANTIQNDVEGDNFLVRRTTNISSLVDALLPTIREFLMDQHLDPMKLDDITENLSGPVIRNRYIYLTEGSLKGLSQLQRVGDTLFVTDNGVSTLYATFGFETLSAGYNYLFKDFLISRRGQLDGRLTNIEIKVVANLNMIDREVDLQAINIVRLDNISLTLRGHVIDNILNAAIKHIANRFRSSIISTIEKEAKEVGQKYLNELIKQIPFSDEYLVDNDILESVPISVNLLHI